MKPVQGLHLTADLYHCRCDEAWLTDAQRLETWCLRACEEAGLQPVKHLFRAGTRIANEGTGVTGVVLLPGSHFCLHTWPQQRTVAADVYVFSGAVEDGGLARALMDKLLERFEPEWTEQRSLDRGDGSP